MFVQEFPWTMHKSFMTDGCPNQKIVNTNQVLFEVDTLEYHCAISVEQQYLCLRDFNFACNVWPKYQQKIQQCRNLSLICKKLNELKSQKLKLNDLKAQKLKLNELKAQKVNELKAALEDFAKQAVAPKAKPKPKDFVSPNVWGEKG